MKKLNILIVGGGMYVSGRGSDNLGTILPAIYQLGNIKSNITILNYSISGQNKTKKQLKKFPKNSNISIHFNLIKNIDNILLKFKFNCAIIAVPDNLHYTYIKKIIQHKIHLITVKPFVTQINHALELIELQKKNNLICQVDFHKRNDEANIILKNLYKKNEFGHLNYFTVEYSQPKFIPEQVFRKWSSCTNIFQYLGVHYVDLVYFITRAKPISVYAVGTNNYLTSKKINTYDSISVLIQWLSKDDKIFNSSFNVNWTDPNNTNAISDQSISLFGTEKKYKSNQTNRGISIYSEGGVKNINPYFSTEYEAEDKIFFKGYGIETFMNFFLDVINFNKKINYHNYSERATFKEALLSVLVTEGVNNSLKNKNKVILEDFDLIELREKSLIANKNLKSGNKINIKNFTSSYQNTGISLNTLRKIKKNNLIKNISKGEILNFSHIFNL